MPVEVSSIFAKLLAFVLLLLLSSDCSASGIRDDGDDHKDRENDSCMMRCTAAGDAFTGKANANVLFALLANDYPWLKLGTTAYEEYDRIGGLVVAFNSDSPNADGIIQMAATLLFSKSKPINYHAQFRIAVAVRLIPGKFVNISRDEKNHETQITDIFKEATAVMPINTTYKLVPFHGSYHELVKEVYRNTFDSIVGCSVSTSEDLSQRQVLSCGRFELNQFFAFMNPFTKEMWFTLAAMTVFNAFVIWLVESTTDHLSGGNLPFRQIGVILWFPLATLFYGGHREPPKNNLTYFVLAPWFILLLLVTSTYTTSFTSMITTSNSETESSSCWLDIKILKKTNAIVGCGTEGSIMCRHLVDVLGFDKENIKHITPQSSIYEYAEALSTGNIKAAFFWATDSSFFLAKYCKGFGSPNCDLRASSVIFPLDSPLVHEISEAMLLLGLKESEKFKQTKYDMISFSDCPSSNSDGTIKQGIGPRPFSGLFMLSGSASGIAMLVTAIGLMKRRWLRLVQGMLIDRGIWIWLATLFSRNQRGNQLQLQLPTI